MIGIWKAYSIEYLYVVIFGTLAFFGLPMLISPIKWAKILGWEIPAKTDLAVYFGRCLGGVTCVIVCFGLKAIENKMITQYYFDFILCNFVIMVFIHIYGWIKQIQPISETLEILYWGGMIILTLLFYPI
jgi:hypothetical protein